MICEKGIASGDVTIGVVRPLARCNEREDQRFWSIESLDRSDSCAAEFPVLEIGSLSP